MKSLTLVKRKGSPHCSKRLFLVIAIGLITIFVGSTQAIDTQIAFSSDRDGNLEIYAIDTDGTNLVRLTNNPARDTQPAWSPDGRKIAFASDRRNGFSLEIYVMNADGGGLVQLTSDHPPAVNDESPSWSPDGTKIAFASNRDESYDIYVMNTDGENPVQLTRGRAKEVTPYWSPDGMKIAFTSSDNVLNSEIYVMDVDGKNTVNLTQNPQALNKQPSWSPDGRRIAFESWAVGNHDIYVMDADGKNIVRLNDNFAWDAFPAWSPDGERIAFTSLRNLMGEAIFVMNSDGSNVTQLTQGANHGTVRWVSWRPVSFSVSLSEKLAIQWGATKTAR